FLLQRWRGHRRRQETGGVATGGNAVEDLAAVGRDADHRVFLETPLEVDGHRAVRMKDLDQALIGVVDRRIGRKIETGEIGRARARCPGSRRRALAGWARAAMLARARRGAGAAWQTLRLAYRGPGPRCATAFAALACFAAGLVATLAATASTGASSAAATRA